MWKGTTMATVSDDVVIYTEYSEHGTPILRDRSGRMHIDMPLGTEGCASAKVVHGFPRYGYSVLIFKNVDYALQWSMGVINGKQP